MPRQLAGYPFVEKEIITKYYPVRGYPFAKGSPDGAIARWGNRMLQSGSPWGHSLFKRDFPDKLNRSNGIKE